MQTASRNIQAIKALSTVTWFNLIGKVIRIIQKKVPSLPGFSCAAWFEFYGSGYAPRLLVRNFIDTHPSCLVYRGKVLGKFALEKSAGAAPWLRYISGALQTPYVNVTDVILI